MKKEKIRIMVADDHAIVCDGVISILAGERDLQFVAQAADGIKTVELVKKHREFLPSACLLYRIHRAYHRGRFGPAPSA